MGRVKSYLLSISKADSHVGHSFLHEKSVKEMLIDICESERIRLRKQYNLPLHDNALCGKNKTNNELCNIARYKIRSYSVWRLCSILNTSTDNRYILTINNHED